MGRAGYRPRRGDIAAAFDELFEVDPTYERPVHTKEKLYAELYNWYRLRQHTNDPPTWTWQPTTHDPIATILKTRVDTNKAMRIGTRVQTAYVKSTTTGRGTQVKQRAFRYLRLRQSQTPTRATNHMISDAPRTGAEHKVERLPFPNSAGLTRTDPHLQDEISSSEQCPLLQNEVGANAMHDSHDGEHNLAADMRHVPADARTPPDGKTCYELARTTAQEENDEDDDPELLYAQKPQFQDDEPTCRSLPRKRKRRFSPRASPEGAVKTGIFKEPHPDQRNQHSPTSPLPPPLYGLEMYADTAPASRYIHTIPGPAHKHTLAVDWHQAGAKGINPTPGSSHSHERFNLNKLTRDDIEGWTQERWGIPAKQLSWIHASVDCTTQSLASASTQKHRYATGTPKTPAAHDSDATINATLEILENIRAIATDILITVENPAHSVFDRHPKVKELLVGGHWRLLESSHCAAAREDFDGPVTQHPQCPGLFPEKRTWWLTTGLPRDAQLPQCNKDCRMLVPDTKVHRLVICQPTKHSLQKGQRVMRLTEPRAKIPLGAMHAIWTKHIAFKLKIDKSDKDCAICGGMDCWEENPLLVCDQEGCTRVQHVECSGISLPDALQPTSWLCRGCTLKRRFNL